MQSIKVNLNKNSYNIFIQKNLRLNFSKIIDSMNQKRKFVIFTQQSIFDLYGIELIQNLQKQDVDIEYILLENSENAKSFSLIAPIYEKIISLNCDRSTLFIALGGGVVGDVTGFLAATFLRGIEYIQIPTTLLAMVDSSIGGKTGINLDSGKNLVGAIWQPKAVLIDPAFLLSLPKREIISGISEIIKYGAILDKDFFKYISYHLDDIVSLQKSESLLNVIYKCGQLKSKIIENDENELDVRRILNFGHTIGHALEKYYNYKILKHGEAVAYGMMAAAKLSIEYCGLSYENYNLLKTIIKKLPLPKLPSMDIEAIVDLVKNDKKVRFGKINFILISDIGKTKIIDSVSKKSIVEVLKTL